MSNNEKSRKRLQIAAYIVMLLLAAMCVFLGIYTFSENQTTSGLLLGLSTELIGTIIIITILKFFLSDSDRSIDEVLDILKSSNSKKQLSYTCSERVALTKLGNELEKRKIGNIMMIGYSMAHVVQYLREILEEALENGATIKIMLLDPYSTAGTLMTEKVGDKVIEPHERTIRYINEINERSQTNNTIQVTKISWVPSCTIIQVENLLNKQKLYTQLVGVNGFVLDDSVARRLYEINSSLVKDSKYMFFENHLLKTLSKYESYEEVQ